jgi:hypothetical protein
VDFRAIDRKRRPGAFACRQSSRVTDRNWKLATKKRLRDSNPAVAKRMLTGFRRLLEGALPQENRSDQLRTCAKHRRENLAKLFRKYHRYA